MAQTKTDKADEFTAGIFTGVIYAFIRLGLRFGLAAIFGAISIMWANMNRG